MTELLSWLGEYSPFVVLLLAVGAGILFVLKLIVEHAVSAEFEVRIKDLELRLERRSDFEQVVLMDRFERVKTLSALLSEAFAQMRLPRKGSDALWSKIDDKHYEYLPLRRFTEEMRTSELILTKDLVLLFEAGPRLVNDASAFALNQAMGVADSHQEQLQVEEEQKQIEIAWDQWQANLKSAIEDHFHLENIRW